MFFGRKRNRIRQQLLTTPLATDARAILHRAAPLVARLPGPLVARHEGVVQILLAEKSFEGAGDLVVTDEMKLAVAGQAALLQLRDDADYFPGLDSIVLYPEAFVADQERWDDGLIHDDEDELSGESWTHGAVVLAWADVQREARRRDGYNVVLHEFAHQLDDQSGQADGTPLLPAGDLVTRWTTAFQAAFEEHAARLERGCEVLFDADAAESPTEFFATAVEVFFEYPLELAREYGEVQTVLADYLQLDPTSWV